MIRNDYRRALIMLRGLNNGYSGHVRLERRTLNGSMQFTVNGALGGEPLSGVLIGESRGNWFSHNLGTLTSNRRDQAALLVSFDPRNIQGRDLDEYQIVGVAQPDKQENPLVMSGLLNSAQDIDWRSAQNAVASMMGGQPQSTGSIRPAGRATGTLPEAVPTYAPSPGPAAKTAAAQSAPMNAAAQPSALQVPVESQPAQQVPTSVPPAPTTAAIPNQPATEQPAAEQPTTEQPAPMQSVGFTVPLSKDAEPPLQATALTSLPNPEQPWPQNMAALRPLFELNPPFDPFPARDYVFVCAPMPTETGESHCAIGIKAVDDQMRILCYAVPGTFAMEPPPGLEGYAWRGSEANGYWTTCIDLQTGEPYDGDDP